MDHLHINALGRVPIRMQPLEIVERKGLGHPDTICDSVMNAISSELSREYVRRFGVVLHHNLDKSLLAAGSSEPAFRGGRITKPMWFILGDRATYKVPGEDPVDVDAIAKRTIDAWFRTNFRFIDPDTIRISSAISQGSGNLTDIFKRRQGGYLGANDTSATVGYAPFTPVETLVLDIEHYMQSKKFKEAYPSTGEDIKVMALREGDNLDVTIATAMVDRFINDETHYFALKDEILRDLTDHLTLSGARNHFADISMHLNAADERGRGADGCYLTVTGTSAEAGDSGQVGRGNDPMGIIPLNRPMASEAAAGKNPVSHVGKIYNLLSFRIAQQIYSEVPGLEEVYVWLLSRIGTPINQPSAVSVQVIPKGGIDKQTYIQAEEVVASEFDRLSDFCRDLYMGVSTVC
jgi:S-adenosylmethionine synthetase